MPIRTHLAALERRNRAPEREIYGEQTHSPCDDLNVAELKRRKLPVKDEISCLQQDVGALVSEVELSAKAKKKAPTRAKLKSSRWYESAARSISISKPL